jgi:3-hydroxyacyl-[acyl-carrier-protein] dehydratase
MLLLNHLYTLVKQTSENGKVQASIAFNKEHKIFEGHFPGHPVVPGVCMIQILREIMEVEVGSRLRIRTGDNLKFLSVINPQENPEVQVSLSYTVQEPTFNINATLFLAEVTFFKFKGTFEKL